MYSVPQQPGSRSESRSRFPYWLIIREPARRGSQGPQIFTLDLKKGKLLPVFASEESAKWFLRHATSGGNPDTVDDKQSATGGTPPVAEGGWRIRAVGTGELVSLLSGSAFSAGPCTGVEKVVLDPSLEIFERAGDEGRVVGENRGCFLERLMGRGRAWFESASRAHRV